MTPGDDTDSGMESQDGSEKKNGSLEGGDVVISKEETTDPDEHDETLAERLWGLTEMFPEPLRNASYSVAMTTKDSFKGFYGFSRSAFWIIFSSSIILFAPVIFEVERVQMEEAQRTQQKQMLLGPILLFRVEHYR
ncbi:hypothetical protein FQR65_LT03418 [Abscondita terminalis]|nr:hypothetical protein FQR65_LT03418 [Abscondita terminalis]